MLPQARVHGRPEFALLGCRPGGVPKELSVGLGALERLLKRSAFGWALFFTRSAFGCALFFTRFATLRAGRAGGGEEIFLLIISRR